MKIDAIVSQSISPSIVQDSVIQNSSVNPSSESCSFMGRVYRWIRSTASSIVEKIKALFAYLCGKNRPSIETTIENKPIPEIKPPIQTTKKPVLIEKLAGISNYNASSCYFAATLQALKSCAGSDQLTHGTDPISKLYKKIFTSLESKKTVPVETTQSWVEDAYNLKLTTYTPGRHGDPDVVLKKTLDNLYKGRSSGLYSVRHDKLSPCLTPFRTIKALQTPEGSDLQNIINGETKGLTPTKVENSETAPDFVAFELHGRSSNTAYLEKKITIPTEVNINADDNAKVPYRLSSAIVFKGDSAAGKYNHYYTYVLKDVNEKGVKTWIEYNDHNVTERVDHDKKIQDMIEKRGYLLFYSKA